MTSIRAVPKGQPVKIRTDKTSYFKLIVSPHCSTKLKKDESAVTGTTEHCKNFQNTTLFIVLLFNVCLFTDENDFDEKKPLIEDTGSIA